MIKLSKFEENRSLSEAEKIYKQRIDDALFIYSKHENDFLERDCPICGENDTTNLEKFHDTYNIVSCNHCSSSYVNPCPDIIALTDYYVNGKSNHLLQKTYRRRHKVNTDYIIDDRIEIVTEYIEKNQFDDVNILEFGCGSGSFLSKLNNAINFKKVGKKVNLTGIDIDSHSISKNVDSEVKLICTTAEDFIKKDTNLNSYDVIVFFELLEHLVDPFQFIVNVYKLLKKDGMVLFTVPNSNGIEDIASGYNSFRLLAHSIFPPMHLNAFSNQNIIHFGLRSGFKINKIETPGKLDVDMISICTPYLKDKNLKELAKLDDETKGFIQYMLTLVNGSSHMRCVFTK